MIPIRPLALASLTLAIGLNLLGGPSRTAQTMSYIVETYTAELNGGTGGVSVDSGGNVYVADFGAILGDTATMGRQIFRVDPHGVVTVFATGFEGASGNEFGHDGYLYQSNIRGNFISKVAPDGSWTELVRDGIVGPVGIAIDDDGVLFVANCGNHTIQRVTPDGTSSRFAADSLFRCPNGLTFDDGHNLYVANFDNGDVLKVTPDGRVSRLATMPGGNNGHLEYHDGFLYVVDRGAHQIQRVSLTGEVTVFAGTGDRGRTDGPALEASFSFPNDIKVGPDGAFYIDEIAAVTGDHVALSPMIVRVIRPSPHRPRESGVGSRE